MTDRYLFRGKREEDEQWENGAFWQSNSSIIDKSGYSQKVIPETVGQCTGLKDKNGKLIFEGDIVCDEQGGYYYIIKWFPEYTSFALADRYGKIAFGVEELEMFLDDLVVAGNIHDNSIDELEVEE